jgi:hypothetical protein
MYKDLGNFVFQEAYSMMRNPKSLIIKLKGVGAWHLRKKRMDIVVTQYPDRGLVKTREDFESDSGYEEYLEKHTQYNIFKERLVDYEKYLLIKDEIKTKRRETQVLLKPTEGQDERFKSS